MPLFREPAALSHGQGIRKKLAEISDIARFRKGAPFNIELNV
jgi:hypothetical protein